MLLRPHLHPRTASVRVRAMRGRRREGLEATICWQSIRSGRTARHLRERIGVPASHGCSFADEAARWQTTVPFPLISLWGTGTALSSARCLAWQLTAHDRTRQPRAVKQGQSYGTGTRQIAAFAGLLIALGSIKTPVETTRTLIRDPVGASSAGNPRSSPDVDHGRPSGRDL